MTVYETDLPGVGRRFEFELTAGGRLVVVVHHEGRCELFSRADDDADAEKLLDLDGDEANVLGSILEGAYFESVNVDALTVPLGDAIIEWIEVDDDSPVAGTSLREASVRSETGVSVVAVRRDGRTVPNPEPEFVLEPGDLLVAIGTREEQSALSHLVSPAE